MPKTTITSTNDVCAPYGKSIIEIMKDRGLVIWADDMENYIKFTEYMELQKERDNRKACAEEREENCWALAKVIDGHEKEIKKLREELAECDDLREELDYRKREAKRLGWTPEESKKQYKK